MKTLADLKRDAKSGQYEVKMIVRCGSTEIPEVLSGWRKMVDSNSVAVFVKANDGRKSELRLGKASLVEYDGETLTIYNAGYRDYTDEEKKVMQKWAIYSSRPQFKAQAEADVYSDGSSTYWSEVAFFAREGMEYLIGTEWKRGMRADRQRNQVQDERIKGTVQMQYKVRKLQQPEV